MALTIADILTRNVITVSPQSSLSESATLMASHKISCLIVSHEHKPIGVLTESDLVRAGSLQLDVDQTAVGDFVLHAPITVEVNQNVYEAFDFLIDHHIRHLVVVNAQGSLEGLVTFTDILKAVSFDDFLKAKPVTDEMSRNVAAINPETSVLDALTVMDRLSISCVIINEDDRAEGIFTERDAARLVSEHTDLTTVTIAEVMITPLITMPESSSLLEASVAMRESGIRRMVIVEETGKATGILTQFDVIRGLEGQRIRHFKTLHQHTEDKLIESQKLLAEKSELERIVAASTAVLYRCVWRDGEFHPTYFSPQLETMLGYDTQEFLKDAWWEKYIHPDDLESVLACLTRVSDHGWANLTYRIKTHSGNWIWVLDHARVSKNSDGTPMEMVGSWMDVSAHRQAEFDLKKSEEKFRSLFDDARDMMHIINTEGRIIDVNQVELDALGFSRDEMIGMPVKEIICRENLEEASDRIKEIFQGKSPPLTEIALRCKSGHCIPVEVSSTPQFDMHGNVIAGRAIIRDISERKESEKVLKASEQKYHNMFESSNDAIFIADTDTGLLIDANEQAEKLLGLQRKQIIGMHQSELHPPEEAERYRKIFTDHIHDDRSFIPNVVVRLADGSDVPVDISANITDIGGKRVIQGVFRDISARKVIERELEGSEAKYRGLVDNLKEAVFQTDSDGNWTFLNRAWQEITGFSVAESIGKMFLDYVYPDDQALNMERFQPLIERKKEFCRHEIRYRHKDGGYRWIEVFARLTLDEDDQITGTTGMLTDITKRKENEQEITQAAERMKRVLDADFDAIIVHQDEKVVFSNNRAQELFGYDSLEQTLGEDVLNCFPPEQRRFASRVARRAIRTGKPVDRLEMVGLSRSRSEPFPMEIASTPIQWSGKPAVVSIVRDITERKATQQQLESERASMRAILNNLPFLAWLKDENSAFIAVNNNFAHASGAASPDELVGKTDLDIWPQELAEAYRADDQEVMKSGKPKAVEEEVAEIDGTKWFETFKSPVFDADGRVVGTVGMANNITNRIENEEQMRLLKSAVASVSESIIITDEKGIIEYVNPAFTSNTGFTTDDAIGHSPAILNSKQQSEFFYKQFWQTIKEGKPWAGRILDRKKDGTIFPVHLSVAPIYNLDGKITHFVAVHEDLTEAEVLQKQMMQSQKMQAVGTMVGGIAHDFNNLLASITGNLYLMRNYHRDSEKTVSRIRGMERSIHHGAQMIKQMLTFARRDSPEMHSLDLFAFINEAFKLAKASIPESIEFELVSDKQLPIWVKADATQLQQVLLNLVTNARHAVEQDENPRITATLTIEEPSPLLMAQHPELISDSGWACLTCSDNGCGISALDVERIFEPFFTTKQVGEGTGLGLAMVYGAVMNHRGMINVESEPKQGTKVSVYLPLHEAKDVQALEEIDVIANGHGQVILVVDDEENLRQVMTEVLRQNNFAVLQASDGEEAVEKFQRHMDKIELVLMDVVMPKMGGVVAAEKIRSINERVPIIFQTGYGEATQLDAAKAIPNSDALQKPVSIPQLMTLIQQKIESD